MYPFNVILVGCTEAVRNVIWPELTALNCHIEAEFLGVESALEALRSATAGTPVVASRGGKAKEPEPIADDRRLFIVHLEKPVDLTHLKRISSMFASSPLVAIFDATENPALAITAMRTGATQVVLMPIQQEDFRTAMQCIAMQSGAEASNGQVIALAGVTGGCGTTTLAINLANEMAYMYHHRVILAELSFLVGKFPVYLDLEPRYTIHELIQEIRRLDVYFVKSALLSLADNENVSILSGPFAPVSPVNIQPADVLYLCDFLRQLADYVVIDVPCTYDNIYFDTLNAADQVVLVAEQKVPSIRSLQMIFNNLKHKQPHLLLNRYDPNVKGFGVQRLQELLQVPRMLTITNDYDAVTSAVNQGKTLRAENPRSKALVDIDNLAKALVPAVEAAQPVAGQGMFKGLMKAFGFKKEGAETMSARPIRLLHVEDNLAHRRLIGHYLNALKEEFKFDIFQAESEAAAVETFRNNGIDFVILDYHLTEGDGLSCLRQLRNLDPLVPIIALSGAATPEIASELLEVGADDYLSKQDLNREALANSVRAALSRKDLVTKVKPPEEQVKLTEKADKLFLEACRTFVEKLGTDFLKQLEELETASRQAKLTVWHLQRSLASASDQLNALQPQGQPSVDRLLRPLFLETVLRVFGKASMGNAS